MGSTSLLAMAPSGETYMVRDPAGRVWLLQPPGAGEPRVIEPDVVELAVAKHGFDRIDRDFANWSELDAFRLARAALVTQPIDVDRRALDLADVDRLFKVIRRWADRDETSRARHAAFVLLKTPVVLTDPRVHDQIVSFIQNLEEPTSPFASIADSEEKRRARVRYREAA